MILKIFLIIILILILFFCIYFFTQSNWEKYNYIKNTKNDTIAIGACVYNCQPYINAVFLNVEKIINLFRNYYIVIVIDIGNDNSLELLKKWQIKLKNLKILKGKKSSDVRTENLSIARNKILNEFSLLQNFNEFIMMDFDNVCSKPINIDVFKETMKNKDKWDAISFNKSDYYDIWALSYDPFYMSCFHWKKINVDKIKKHFMNIINNISKDSLYPCLSAFNGFAIYKSNIFLQSKYDFKFYENKKFLTNEMIEKNIQAMDSKLKENHWNGMDCEHRFFHFYAKYKLNAKIFISPKILF